MLDGNIRCTASRLMKNTDLEYGTSNLPPPQPPIFVQARHTSAEARTLRMQRDREATQLVQGESASTVYGRSSMAEESVRRVARPWRRRRRRLRRWMNMFVMVEDVKDEEAGKVEDIPSGLQARWRLPYRDNRLRAGHRINSASLAQDDRPTHSAPACLFTAIGDIDA